MTATDQAPTADARSVEKAFRPSGWLLEATTSFGRAIETNAVAKTGYNSTMLDLIVRLRFAPDRRLRGVDLCERMLKSPGYVSRVIDQGEGLGLVRRQPDPNDRRAQQITLTAAGERAFEAFVPHALEVLNQTIYTALDDEEVETLIDLLTRVSASVHAVLDDSIHASSTPGLGR
jgi:DNA-binding MarR family transcriptional regulator